jgi:tight adherence protein B
MDIVILAPSAAFIGTCLLILGLYRVINHRGVLARQQIAPFLAAASQGATAGSWRGAPLLMPKRFSKIPGLNRALQQSGKGSRLALDLARAGLSMSPGEYLLVRAFIGLFTGFIVYRGTGSAVFAIAALGCGYFLPVLYVRHKTRTRVQQFDTQLVDALILLSNALKSGYSFLQGMETVAREMPAPLGPEFGMALKDIRIGASIEDALEQVAARLCSLEFELVRTALAIQRQVGGNLTEILVNISQTIRGRQRLVGEVRVLTAEQRWSGWIMAIIPVLLALALRILNPTYIQGMWGDPIGRLILLAGFVMNFIGLLVIRKLMDIEV